MYCSTLTRVELHASFPTVVPTTMPTQLQYPHTGRTSCIRLLPRHRQRRQCIAVPSHGSNFMHLPDIHERRAAEGGIAVPSHGSNFMHLNRSRRCLRRGFQIAVPSHGSNFMHREYPPDQSHQTQYCSTLTRVELHASAGSTGQHAGAGKIAVPSHGSNFMHPKGEYPPCRS